MGQGLPYHPECRIAFVDEIDNAGSDDADNASCALSRLFAWRDLQEIILDVLGDRWTEVDRTQRTLSMTRMLRDVSVIGASALHRVGLLEDDYGRAHIVLAARDDIDASLHGLADHHLDRIANRLFTRLDDICTLRVRASAWTSAPWSGAQRAKLSTRGQHAAQQPATV